jgi:hypothetical protein
MLFLENRNRTVSTKQEGGWYTVAIGISYILLSNIAKGDTALTKGISRYCFKIDMWYVNGIMIGVIQHSLLEGYTKSSKYPGNGHHSLLY